MRCTVLSVAVLALAGSTIALPLSGDAPTRRDLTLEKRQYPPFPGFDSYEGYIPYSGGDATTGDADDANGGSVTNDAGPDGTVDNETGSVLGGAGGTSTSGTAHGGTGGGNASSGNAGSANGGDVVNTGGTIYNVGGSSVGGAGGTSTSGDAIGGDAVYEEFRGFDF